MGSAIPFGRPRHERQRPVRLQAVRPDLVDHDVTEQDTLPVVRPGRGRIVDDVGVLGDLERSR